MSATAQQSVAPVPSRMSLGALVKGRKVEPLRTILYAPEGIGKTTFGASAPGAIFLGAEEGSAQLDVTRFPSPQTWTEVFDAIRLLTNETHDFKTLVVDTLDWIEPLCWAHICKRDNKKDVEDYGYGKGYQAALEEWRLFLGALERMRKAKPINVLMLAHSWIKPFKNPAGDDFDRYELKLNNKAAGLLKEWADDVLFANYEQFGKKDERTKRVRGVDTGARIIFTERRAAYDAKNRHSLPETLPLSWADYQAAVGAGRVAEPQVLRDEILRKAKDLGEQAEKMVQEALAKAGNEPQSLALINNRVNARLAEKLETAAATAEKAN
jgi:hypothetical protein